MYFFTSSLYYTAKIIPITLQPPCLILVYSPFQNDQNILRSINEKLSKLDNFYNTHLSTSLETKLDHFSHKLDTLEEKISRLETIIHVEMDKVSENISSKNFKDDIVKDHLLRKIDSVYDRINHRLVYVELQMEMNEKKLQVKFNYSPNEISSMT